MRNAVLQAGLAALLLLAAGCARRPALEPAVLPHAVVGQRYEVAFNLRGQTTPVNHYSVTSGALPEGLRLQPTVDRDNPGVRMDVPLRIVGTPREAGDFSFALRVSTFGTKRPGLRVHQDFELKVAPSLDADRQP